MNLKLLFFASLREQFGFSQKEIALSRTVKSPEEFLLIMSKESGGEWINLFNNKKLYKVAINKDLASWRLNS